MTAVERVAPFMTQERNQSPISEGHVAKKSTAKSRKCWSDLNNLSQKSDSQASSSQNSGPLFPEDDSLETDELNDSNDMVVNGNGRMSDDDVEEGELLSDEGDGKEDPPTKTVCANADEQNGSDKLKTNETVTNTNDNVSQEDSPLSSLEETQEETPHSSNGVVSQEASGKNSPTEDVNPQCDNNTLNDKSDKGKSGIVNDNGVNSGESPMDTEDSNSTNSNSVSSKINKLLISSSDGDKNKLLVSKTFKGNLKDAVRRVSVQSDSDRDSGCSSPRSVTGRGNLFENILQREDTSKDSAADHEEDKTTGSAKDEPKPNGSADKVMDRETNNYEKECDKESENKLSAIKSDDHTESDIGNSILDEPDSETNKEEHSAETNGDEMSDLKENKDEKKNVLKTDNVNIKQDIEMTEDTDCDKDSKPITKVDNAETTSVKVESVKEEGEVGKQVNGGAKRPLSPTDVPSTAAKRSKLEEMIGRLSSSVGKKPEEVENMDDVESDSTSDSESSSENDKQITLTVKVRENHLILTKIRFWWRRQWILAWS